MTSLRISTKRKSEEDEYDGSKRNKVENLCHQYKSIDIKVVEFYNRTSRDKPDIQYTADFLQLYCPQTNSPNCYLLVDNDGNVVCNGKQTDVETHLEIIHWWPYGKSEYQIVGRCQKTGDKPLILYMDGDKLKTKEFHPEKNKNYHSLDRSTIFHFLSREGKPFTNFPFIIKGDKGEILSFGKDGNFLSSKTNDTINQSYRYFVPKKVTRNSRETSL